MATRVKDPVCGVDIDPATAVGKSEYKGQTHYYCLPGCNKSFDKDPKTYIGHGGHQQQH